VLLVFHQARSRLTRRDLAVAWFCAENTRDRRRGV